MKKILLAIAFLSVGNLAFAKDYKFDKDKPISEYPIFHQGDTFDVDLGTQCPKGYMLVCASKVKKRMYVSFDTFMVNPEKYLKYTFYRDVVLTRPSGSLILKRP